MAHEVQVPIKRSVRTSPTVRFNRLLLNRFLTRFAASPVSFEIVLPDGSNRVLGGGDPVFRVVVGSGRALRALGSLDESRIVESYLAGDLTVEGDMLQSFALRTLVSDVHPLITAWRFIEPFIFGQVRTNKRAIASHYDRDPEFFLSFLDPEQPIYTQGVYESEDEPLSAAALRKFAYCFEKCNLKRGDRMLEIGPGWGAWLKYAASRGVQCTGISISQASLDYLKREAAKGGYDWELVFSDLLEYQAPRKFDAIVMMGVIEHLPQYGRLLRKFAALLRPGGRIFIDGSACGRKYELASTMVKYIFPGNHSLLALHEFLEEIERTPLRIMELLNDGRSYFLTFRQWARNFERNRDAVVRRFGEFDYRLFRLYLWATAYQFQVGGNTCYRMVLDYPAAG